MITKISMKTGKIVTIDEIAPSFPDDIPVPEAVSAFQFKAHLDALGKLEEAETLVAQSPKIVQMAWNNAPTFRRNSPTVNQMASRLGFTTEKQKDDFFTQAAEIEL